MTLATSSRAPAPKSTKARTSFTAIASTQRRLRLRLPTSSVAPSQLQQRPPRLSRRRPHRPDGPAPEATGHVAVFRPLDDHRGYVAAPFGRYRCHGHVYLPLTEGPL